MQSILENCANYFTDVKLNKDSLITDEDKEKYWNKLNVMVNIYYITIVKIFL